MTDEKPNTTAEQDQPAVTGDEGRQFVSSTVTNAMLDKALGTDAELAALLRDIPE